MEKISTITDNFLAEEEFVQLRDVITRLDFYWQFSPVVTFANEEASSPGLFFHTVYDNNAPNSSFYNSHFLSILEQLNPESGIIREDVVILSRIKINLNYRLPEPYKYMFHLDITLENHVAAQWTTSILYMNTNNGYTELEDGTKIESVENRLVSFASNIEHRGITQTDEQTRILINFNYLKLKI